MQYFNWTTNFKSNKDKTEIINIYCVGEVSEKT